MSDLIENLKIVVHNYSSMQESTNAAAELELNVKEDEKMIEMNDTVQNTLIVQDNANDETEFHVNLDQVPLTLKQTLTKEKLYYNTVEPDSTIEDDIKMLTAEQLSGLYESLAINEEDFSAGHLRADALHLFGVDDMNTEDVFGFFLGYKPTAIEWINDTTCNIVWKDKNLAALALIDLTKSCDDQVLNNLFVELEQNKSETLEKNEENLKIKEKLLDLFKQNKYRLSMKKANNGFYPLMRYAKISDRKIKGAEARSTFYVKHGNPNYDNLKGLISNSKRKRFKRASLNNTKSESDIDEEVSNANDTIVIEKKNVYSRLSLDNQRPHKRKMKMYSEAKEEESSDETSKRQRKHDTSESFDARKHIEKRRQQTKTN